MILHFTFYNAAQLVPVCGDQVLFFLAATHIDGDIVGICDDQRAAALEAGDVVDLGIGQLQDALHALCFLFLQVQNDFDFAVVQDAAAVFSIFQGKEVVQILRGNQYTTAVAANRLDGLEYIVGSQRIGRCTDPALRVKFRPPPINEKSALKKGALAFLFNFDDTIIAESYCSKKDFCCADVVPIYCISADKFSNVALWHQCGYMN